MAVIVQNDVKSVCPISQGGELHGVVLRCNQNFNPLFFMLFASGIEINTMNVGMAGREGAVSLN